MLLVPTASSSLPFRVKPLGGKPERNAVSLRRRSDSEMEEGRGRGRGRGRGGRGGRGGNSSEQGILLAPSPAGRSQARGAGIRYPPRGGDGPTPADCDFQYVRVSDGIVGTCSDVERRYVRVQSQPDPASVRPAAVLAEALQAVARREAAGEPYETTSDFYMSICQDLRLQQIENELTVAARESFALCAMRARVGPPDAPGMDIKALTNCLLSLEDLYKKNPGQQRQIEFAVYGFLLWLGMMVTEGDSGANTARGLNNALQRLTAGPFVPSDSDDEYHHCDGCGVEPMCGARWTCNMCADFDLCPACYAALGTPGATVHESTHTFTKQAIQPAVVKHALRVMSAVLTGEALRYFALIAAAPAATREQSHIHETLLAPAVRMRAYLAMIKAYKFSIPLPCVSARLGLAGDDLHKWLAQQRAVFDADALDADASSKALRSSQSVDVGNQAGLDLIKAKATAQAIRPPVHVAAQPDGEAGREKCGARGQVVGASVQESEAQAASKPRDHDAAAGKAVELEAAAAATVVAGRESESEAEESAEQAQARRAAAAAKRERLRERLRREEASRAVARVPASAPPPAQLG